MYANAVIQNYVIVVCDGDDHHFVVVSGTVERFGWITANGDTSAEWRELKFFKLFLPW